MLCDFVSFSIDEVTVGIEMFLIENRLLDKLVRELASKVHELLEHFVVGSTWEHDFAGVELVQANSH